MHVCVCVCVCVCFFNIIIKINVLVWGGNIRGKNGQRTKEKHRNNSSAVFNADALGSVTLASLRGNKHVQKLGR